MRLRFRYFSILAVLLICPSAYAAKNEEMVRIPSLFMLGDINQVVGVSYDYSGHSATGTSSFSTNSLREHYSLSSDAAIRDPHLVSILFSLGLVYSQEFGSQHFNLLDWEYDIAASGWDLSYHPVTVVSARNSSLVSNGYSPTYTLTRDNNKVNAALLNSLLPVQFYFSHDTMSTSGLPVNTTTTSDTVNLTAHHDYNDVSHTQFSLGYTSSHTSAQDTKGYALILTNNLSFDPAHHYTLDSNLQANDTLSGGVPQKDLVVKEDLNCRLGAGLAASFSEQYNTTSTVDFQNNSQSSWSNSLSGTLNHHLYRSLDTNLLAFVTNGGLLGGSTLTYGGALKLNYNKLLPAQSLLNLTASEQLQYNKQNLVSTLYTIRNEPHIVTHKGNPPIQLSTSGKLLSPPVVQSYSAQQTLHTYLENIDYTVDYNLNQITVLTTGGIDVGTNLQISYDVNLNPSVTYLTDTKNFGGSLTFLNGRYSVGATLSTQGQHLISGQANNQSLINSTIFESHADATYTNTTMGAQYGIYDSTQERYSHLGAHWNLVTSYTEEDAASFNVTDTFTMYPSSGTTHSAGYDENVLTLATTYARRVLQFLHLDLALSLSDDRRGGSYSDYVLLRGGLTGAYNQLVFNLNAQTRYRFAGGVNTTDNSVHCSVSRSF